MEEKAEIARKMIRNCYRILSSELVFLRVNNYAEVVMDNCIAEWRLVGVQRKRGESKTDNNSKDNRFLRKLKQFQELFNPVGDENICCPWFLRISVRGEGKFLPVR